jgi:hypothetical protein
MAAETQYTANTGNGIVSTANANLDGTGTLATILTAASEGTIIKSITIKAHVTTTQGMVRLFITGGGSTKLLAEIEVPAVIKSATAESFYLYMPTDYVLQSGDVLKASTENAEAMSVIAEGLDWAYYATPPRPESTEYTANTGMVNIATANANLDGTGTLGTVLTAALNGTIIQSINIKALVNTTAGMVRLFIYDGANTRLLMEVPVMATTKSATAHSFSARVNFLGNGFALQSGWLLKASTEKAESINVIAEALDWQYPA